MLFSFKTMGKSSLLFLAVSVLQNKWKTKFYLSPPFFFFFADPKNDPIRDSNP